LCIPKASLSKGQQQMANPEHLEILSQGVEVWNKWNGDPEKYRKSVDRLVRDLNRRSAAR
jgi:hypothetical protein